MPLTLLNHLKWTLDSKQMNAKKWSIISLLLVEINSHSKKKIYSPFLILITLPTQVVHTLDLVLQLLEERGIISSLNDHRNSYTPKDTRDKVVHELLETERKYVQDLEILQNYMRELQIQEVINPDTIHYLFGNLNTLVDFQRRFLIQLEEIGEKIPEEQNFGQLFSVSEDQFTVYEPYCSNYFSAQDIVVQEAPRLQKLAGILNPVYELPSMLIKPVQRICKYPLLLQQLIKSTSPDWPHFDEMSEGLESVKRVTERVNETQRKHENIQVVEELKRRVDEMRTAQIDSFGSLLLHEKMSIRQSDEGEKEMQIYFFERTMLMCKESKDSTKNNPKKSGISIKKKRRGSLQPKGLIVISKILSVRNASTGEGNWCLAITWKDRDNVDNVVFRFRNEEQVKLWESTIKRRMGPQKKNVSNTQLASMKSAPASPVPSALRTDEEDEQDDFERARSNSLSAHLLNTISGRPKIPRNMSADQTNIRYNHSPIPRSSSSSNTQNDYYFNYPASPPPSNPSSPTTSSRASQSSTTSAGRVRDGSPLADIASKFMATSISDNGADDYRQFPLPPTPHSMTRSQSHSPYPQNGGNVSPMFQQQQLQQSVSSTSSSSGAYNPNNIRLRSQSSPNIHNNSSSSKYEDAPQLPAFNSRTLYQTPPSPLDSPIRDSNISYRTTTTTSTSSRLSDAPSSPQMNTVTTTSSGSTLKLKLNYDDNIYAIMCSTDILYYELMDKVERKIRLLSSTPSSEALRLKYQDEDGDMITINSNEDIQMAFESRGNSNAINIYVSV